MEYGAKYKYNEDLECRAKITDTFDLFSSFKINLGKKAYIILSSKVWTLKIKN